MMKSLKKGEGRKLDFDVEMVEGDGKEDEGK